MTDSNETGDVALLVYCGLLGGCRAELQTPDFSFGDVEDEIADMLLAGDDGAKQLEEVSQELTRSTAYQSIIKAANEVTNEPPKKKAVKKKQAK
ncbi:hypothetical protein FJZ26_05590 [Candidatus Parvarchaeota archaeon]|nr:hypothetical protein [Candidatus Parvarchaeota archaeon]